MTFDQADDYAANDVPHCRVPGCDEQPYPGEAFCETHQQEQQAAEQEAMRRLNAFSRPAASREQ